MPRESSESTIFNILYVNEVRMQRICINLSEEFVICLVAKFLRKKSLSVGLAPPSKYDVICMPNVSATYVVANILSHMKIFRTQTWHLHQHSPNLFVFFPFPERYFELGARLLGWGL